MAKKKVNCYICNGLGNRFDNTKDSNGNFITVERDCSLCNGTGEIDNMGYYAQRDREKRDQARRERAIEMQKAKKKAIREKAELDKQRNSQKRKTKKPKKSAPTKKTKSPKTVDSDYFSSFGFLLGFLFTSGWLYYDIKAEGIFSIIGGLVIGYFFGKYFKYIVTLAVIGTIGYFTLNGEQNPGSTSSTSVSTAPKDTKIQIEKTPSVSLDREQGYPEIQKNKNIIVRSSVGNGLQGRGILNKFQVTDSFTRSGTVVIKTCVDANGRVILANFTQRGSTTTDSQLVRIAKKNALKYKFSAGSTDKQCGTITYIFSQVKYPPFEKELSPSETVVSDFINALGERDFKKAFSYQGVQAWGNFSHFSSSKSFGGITKTKIWSQPKIIKCTKDSKAGCKEVQIFVQYLAIDPQNDPCPEGQIYAQNVWVSKENGNWRITGWKLIESHCPVGVSAGAGSAVGGGLRGRGIINTPKITDDFNKPGKVVIKVCVDTNGQVISANFTQRGSTTTDSQLVRIAKKHAFKHIFSKGEVDKQCGTITCVFKVK